MAGCPPPLPAEFKSTGFWCEENVYLLIQQFLLSHITASWDVFAIIVSNVDKSVALWNQKLAQHDLYPVVWDYHVVMALRLRTASSSGLQQSDGADDLGDTTGAICRCWVYDFDTRLGLPCPAERYITQSFCPCPARFQSMFRVVPGQDYIDYFASDRSHMLLPSPSQLQIEGQRPEYSKPPPDHPCLVGKKAAEAGVTNNLMQSFVSMDMQSLGTMYGRVLTLQEMVNWISVVQ
ncbi:hypothetical protein BDN71DRAFT_1501767 [Pleurotus eryngii]|uniref:Protein N-terminal glutamine amidohydrolase n=1 Tax=Pleurotus eryngii TaxID=5323 RepID=A0A9P6A7I8_PLEER|nr:hypothetical protein BDN71DRAFT_1501767 [Pleurotus eryngii]